MGKCFFSFFFFRLLSFVYGIIHVAMRMFSRRSSLECRLYLNQILIFLWFISIMKIKKQQGRLKIIQRLVNIKLFNAKLTSSSRIVFICKVRLDRHLVVYKIQCLCCKPWPSHSLEFKDSRAKKETPNVDQVSHLKLLNLRYQYKPG